MRDPIHNPWFPFSSSSPTVEDTIRQKKFTSGKVDDHIETGYGSNKSNQPSSYMMTSRGSNYRAFSIDTLSGYHNMITAAYREKGNTVSEWPHNITCNTTIIIQRHKVNNNQSTRKHEGSMPTQIIQYLQTQVQYSNSNLRYTAPTLLDAVAHEQVATYPKQAGSGTQSPPRTDCPPLGLGGAGYPPSGMSCPSVGVCVSGGIPESTSGTAGGGELHGSRRSTWTVCRARLQVCFSTTTSGDLNDSMRQGPVQRR